VIGFWICLADRQRSHHFTLFIRLFFVTEHDGTL